MNKITQRTIQLGAVALAALMLVGIETNSAQAAHGFGLHIGGRNVHLDIGNPHGSYYTASRQATYRRPYSNPRWYGHGGGQAHYDWHDTSHIDYIPGRYVPHGNHIDYIPAQRVWHQDGHYDLHRGGHHGGHRGGHH